MPFAPGSSGCSEGEATAELTGGSWEASLGAGGERVSLAALWIM